MVIHFLKLKLKARKQMEMQAQNKSVLVVNSAKTAGETY